MATLADLKPDKRNARKHNPRNVATIESSIQRDGFGRPVFTANDGTIIGGNATVEAAASAGLEDVIIIDSDGTKVIAIRRTDVEPGSPEFHRLAVSDNRSAELSDGWIGPVLQSLIDDELIDPDDYWYEPELDRLLAALDDAPPFDPAAEWTGMPEFHQEDQTAEFKCTVNFATAEDLEAFERLVGQSVPRNTKSIWYPPQERQRARDFAYVEAEDAA